LGLFVFDLAALGIWDRELLGIELGYIMEAENIIPSTQGQHWRLEGHEHTCARNCVSFGSTLHRRTCHFPRQDA
jgi:hypothetical protein